MARSIYSNRYRGIVTLLISALVVAPSYSALSQEQKMEMSYTCQLPNTDRITVYKFLARLAYIEFRSAKYEAAAKAASNLEFTWDETNGCFQYKGVPEKQASKIDELIDAFIGPIRLFKEKKPDPVQVEAAFKKLEAELDASTR